METLYGDFTAAQLNEYRDRLHKKMFWLLLYKDPKTCGDFIDVDYDKYFESLMRELNGLSDILLRPTGIVEMLSILQAAYNETQKSEFNYMTYRKFVLDAHTLLDKMNWEVGK